MTRLNTLYAPINDFRARTVEGGLTAANAAVRCALAFNVPPHQIHPRVTVDLGNTTVLDAEMPRLLSARHFKHSRPSI